MVHRFAQGMASVALGALVACNPLVAGPDLVPEGVSGHTGRTAMCRLGQGGLFVRVRNQSNVDVLLPTETRVTLGGVTASMTTPPIPAGSFADTGPFAIPPGCFSPDCGVAIAVDAGEAVAEAPGSGAEANNTAAGLCIG